MGKHLHEWMELNGFEQIGKGHYDIDMMYHLPKDLAKHLLRYPNELLDGLFRTPVWQC